MTPTPGQPLSEADVSLLPCPFCGGKAEASQGGDVWFVHCRAGGCYESHQDFMRSEAEAAALWNRRPHAPVSRPGDGGEIGAEYDAAAHCVTLAECPPGLFFWNGTLGFKSEYGAMEPTGSNFKTWKVGNRADAYCADSGEYFWGGTSNHEDRAKVLVMPIDAATVAMVASHGPAALTPPAELVSRPAGEGEREAVARVEAMLPAIERIFPVHVTETPDYAELAFNECAAQAMTMEPDTWTALNSLASDLRLILSLLRPAAPDAGGGEDDEMCPHGDHVPADLPPGETWTCPICDAEWYSDEAALQPGGER